MGSGRISSRPNASSSWQIDSLKPASGSGGGGEVDGRLLSRSRQIFKNHAHVTASYLVTSPLSETPFWRLLCHGQVVVVRVDPLADLETISDHARAIHGASNLHFETAVDDLMNYDCPGCSITHVSRPCTTSVWQSSREGEASFWLNALIAWSNRLQVSGL
jgi:hypothetical protein